MSNDNAKKFNDFHRIFLLWNLFILLCGGDMTFNNDDKLICFGNDILFEVGFVFWFYGLEENV